MSVNSKAKGKRGELELVKYLKSWGVDARRGQQFKGGSDSPDIVHDIPGVHIECKRSERIGIGTDILSAAVDQAVKEKACGEDAFVFWRRSRAGWNVSWREYAPFRRRVGDLRGVVQDFIVTASADDWMTAMGYERKTK